MIRRIRRAFPALGLFAITSCGTVIAGPDPSADPVTVLDAAWKEVDLHYPFFDLLTTDPAATYATLRGALRPTSSDAELRGAICALLRTLHSYHTTLVFPGGSCSYSGTAYQSDFSHDLLVATVPGLKTTSNGRFAYAVVTSDIGYVGIPSFAGDDWGNAIDDVLDALGPVRALIVDIRGNGGGSDDNALAVAARFADREYIYQYGHFRNGPGHGDFTPGIAQRLSPAGRNHFGGPIALLTDRGDGSAAEDFVAMLRVLPNTLTVGDTTIGNSSNPLWRELPNGWQMRIPQSRQTTPDGLDVEGRGYPPTVTVRLTAFDVASRVDTVIRRAIAELRARLR